MTTTQTPEAPAVKTESNFVETSLGQQTIKGKIGSQTSVKEREGQNGKPDYVTFDLCQNAPTPEDTKAVIWHSVSIPQSCLFPVLKSGLTVEVTGYAVVRTDTQTEKSFNNLRGFNIKFF